MSKKIKLSDAQKDFLFDGKSESGVHMIMFNEPAKEKRGDKLVSMGLMTREMMKGHGSVMLWVYKTIVEAPVIETPAAIEEPAADEIELDTPTDATLGDELFPETYVYACVNRPPEEAAPAGYTVVSHTQSDATPYGTIAYASALSAYDAWRYDLRNMADGYAVGETVQYVQGGKVFTDTIEQVNEDDTVYLEDYGKMSISWIHRITTVLQPLSQAPEILPEVAPLPAANMYTNTIAAKDAYISQLEAELKRFEVNLKSQIAENIRLEAQVYQLDMAHEAAKAHIEKIEAQMGRREAILSKHHEFVRDMCGYSFSDRDDARFVSDCIDELERN